MPKTGSIYLRGTTNKYSAPIPHEVHRLERKSRCPKRGFGEFRVVALGFRDSGFRL